MKFWPNSEMKTFFGDKTPVDIGKCQVRLGDHRIEVIYEYDPGEEEVYEGEEIGEGHFELKARIGNGKGNLHRFSNGKILDGWWLEDGDEGMWRITLIE
jgi:hypothetical protein